MRIAARCDKQTGSLDFPVMFLPAGRAKMGVSVRYTAPCPPSEEGKSLYSLLRSAFFNMLCLVEYAPLLAIRALK